MYTPDALDSASVPEYFAIGNYGQFVVIKQNKCI